jgi:hypothetical protein
MAATEKPRDCGAFLNESSLPISLGYFTVRVKVTDFDEEFPGLLGGIVLAIEFLGSFLEFLELFGTHSTLQAVCRGSSILPAPLPDTMIPNFAPELRDGLVDRKRLSPVECDLSEEPASLA